MIGGVGDGSWRDEPSKPPGPRATRTSFPGPTLGTSHFLRVSSGAADDSLGGGTFAHLVTDHSDASRARTASGVKRGIPVERRADVRNGCRGNTTGIIRGGLSYLGIVGCECGVADGGGASTATIDGGRGGGWDCAVGEGCFGRVSTTRRAIDGAIGTSCSRFKGGYGRWGASSRSWLQIPWGRDWGGCPHRTWLQ